MRPRKRALSRDAFGVTVPNARHNDYIEWAMQHALLFLVDGWKATDVKRIIERIREEKRVIHRDEPKDNMLRSNSYKFHFNWCSRFNAFLFIVRKVLKEFSPDYVMAEVDAFIRAQLLAWVTVIFSVPTTFCASDKNIKDKYEAIEDILLFMLETVLSQIADCAFNRSYAPQKNDDAAIFRAKVVVRALHAKYMTSFQSTKNQYSGLFPSQNKLKKKKSGGEKTFAKTIEVVCQILREVPARSLKALLKIRHEPLNPLHEEPYGCCEKALDDTYRDSFCARSSLLDFFLNMSSCPRQRMAGSSPSRTPSMSARDPPSPRSRTSSTRTSPSLPMMMKQSPPLSPLRLPMPSIPPLTSNPRQLADAQKRVAILERQLRVQKKLVKYTLDCVEYELRLATQTPVFPTKPPPVQYNESLPSAEQQQIFLGVWQIIARTREERRQQYIAQKEERARAQAQAQAQAELQRQLQGAFAPSIYQQQPQPVYGNVPSQFDTNSVFSSAQSTNFTDMSSLEMNDSHITAHMMYESLGGGLQYLPNGCLPAGVGSTMDGNTHSNIVPQPIVSAESVRQQTAAPFFCASTPSMQPMGMNGTTPCPPSHSFLPSRASYSDFSFATTSSLQSGATDMMMNPYISDNGRNTSASASQPPIFQSAVQGSCAFGCNGNADSREVVQSSFENFTMDVDVNE